MIGFDDEKSEICRLATQLLDTAELYERAATTVEDAGTSSWLVNRAECRRQMMNSLLARAGLSGEAAGTILPTPEALWLEASSLVSAANEAVIKPVRSADRALLQKVEDYLRHANASGQPASAARWLRDVLEPQVERVQDTVPSKNQPG